MTGEVLAGRYRLERELGRGGMATVFLATDLRLSRPVALKRMHPGGGTGRTERFRREAELAASLHHPNVLDVHDYGEDEAHGPFLVCEWVRGEDLRALAGRLSPVPAEAVMVLGWELARALAAAHARGIVHRDVKPDNVLVAEGGPLKLADFGLAALEDQERLTSTGAVTGSLPYMAPERIDTGAYSPASDVYAVGVILFELCSGTTPHAGKGAAHLAASVMTKDAPPLTEVVPGTPEPLAALVARCLAKDARDRPRDGAELALALETLLQREVGPPADVARAFLGDPMARASRWRRARFERLLEEGRGLLVRGEGARAAKVLNAALMLEPTSAEVMALLRERPRRSGWRAGAIGAGLVLCAAMGWAWSHHQGPEGEKTPRSEASPPGKVSPEPATIDGTSTGERGHAPSPTGQERPPPSTAPRQLDTSRNAEPLVESDATKPAEDFVPSEPSSDSAVVKPVRPSVSKRRSEGTDSAKRAVSALPTGHSAGAESTGATPISVPTPRPDMETAVPAHPALLKVTARPWAEVFVNGESQGYTPRVRELSLPAGTYRLRFVNPLCDEVEQEVTLAPGETVTRDVVLSPRKAEVLIRAPAGARLFVDGREVGVAPLPGPVAVEHGRHTVTARRAGAPPVQREVDVVAGRRLDVALDVTP
ncbi:protein kinase domain-containing protein [Myxococcus sp. Y35]|uniref:serine/threonine-protein kinase n=1 Tax=Pseudomyxococcus flavus TaxID=3115648 RepID=UPI003CEDE00E